MLFCKATVAAFFCTPTCFKNLNHKILPFSDAKKIDCYDLREIDQKDKAQIMTIYFFNVT